jgi:hypothetical protein
MLPQREIRRDDKRDDKSALRGVRVVTRGDRVRFTDLTIPAMHAELASAVVVQNLSRTVDRLGL